MKRLALLTLILALLMAPLTCHATTPQYGEEPGPGGSTWLYDLTNGVWRAAFADSTGMLSGVSPAFGSDAPIYGTIPVPNGGMLAWDDTNDQWVVVTCDSTGKIAISSSGSSMDTTEIQVLFGGDGVTKTVEAVDSTEVVVRAAHTVFEGTGTHSIGVSSGNFYVYRDGVPYILATPEHLALGNAGVFTSSTQGNFTYGARPLNTAASFLYSRYSTNLNSAMELYLLLSSGEVYLHKTYVGDEGGTGTSYDGLHISLNRLDDPEDDVCSFQYKIGLPNEADYTAPYHVEDRFIIDSNGTTKILDEESNEILVLTSSEVALTTAAFTVNGSSVGDTSEVTTLYDSSGNPVVQTSDGKVTAGIGTYSGIKLDPAGLLDLATNSARSYEGWFRINMTDFTELDFSRRLGAANYERYMKLRLYGIFFGTADQAQKGIFEVERTGSRAGLPVVFGSASESDNPLNYLNSGGSTANTTGAFSTVHCEGGANGDAEYDGVRVYFSRVGDSVDADVDFEYRIAIVNEYDYGNWTSEDRLTMNSDGTTKILNENGDDLATMDSTEVALVPPLSAPHVKFAVYDWEEGWDWPDAPATGEVTVFWTQEDNGDYVQVLLDSAGTTSEVFDSGG